MTGRASRPKPPAILGRSGASLWRAIVGDLEPGWELDRRERQALLRACTAEDHIAALQERLDAQGPMLLGSAGQPVLHPAIGEIRQLALAQSRLLASLELTDPAAARAATPAQARARRAAEARWGARREREARRHG